MSQEPSTPQGRKRVGLLAGLVMATVAAAVLSGIVAADRLLISNAEFAANMPAPYTLRVSPLQPSPLGAEGGAIGIARGAIVDANQATLLQGQGGISPASGAALYLGLFCLLLGWSAYLRSTHWGARLRNQLVTLATVALSALVLRLLFVLTSFSIVAAPVVLVGLLVGKRSGRGPALASGALMAAVVSIMVPFELGILATLLAQALVAPLLLRRNAPAMRVLLAIAAAGLASAMTYALAYAAHWQALPSLADPLRSTWLAALLAAGIGALLVFTLGPVFDWLCGEVSRRTLSNLERLSQPLLRQISTQSPGTWQHSLAMAKLANGAGIAIGADLQLIRVGAYYHDLGKSVAPKYFIENLSGSETSVHENLKPAASRDAIFAHVSAGVRLAKEARLPSRIIDFISSHHCAAPLEYFWTLEQLQSPRSKATPQEFCYPGTKPQCRETGIMSICDAVEGASRSLKNPSHTDVEALVHHIVYGKLRAGQLDEAGLSLADIQKIDESLSHSLNLAHASEPTRARGADAISTAISRPSLQDSLEDAAPKLALLSPVRLDSLDQPKSSWHNKDTTTGKSPQDSGSGLAFVETEAVTVGRAVSESDIAEEIDTEEESVDTTNYEGSQASAMRAKLAAQGLDEVTSTTDHLRTRERPAEIVPEDRVTMPRPAQASGIEDRVTAPRDAQDVEERITAPRDAQEVEERITAPQDVQEIESRVTAPREVPKIAKRITAPQELPEVDEIATAREVEQRVTTPREVQEAIERDFEETAALAFGTRRRVQPVQGSSEVHEEPLLLESPIRGKEEGQAKKRNSNIGKWQAALDEIESRTAGAPPHVSGPPAPPPGGHHISRATIPLGKDELQLAPAPPSASRPSKRADSNDGMKPGEMVIGAPPATHPERTLPGIMVAREEITAQHNMLPPDEARRPEDRITEESPAVVPLEAYPETISADSPRAPKPASDDES